MDAVWEQWDLVCVEPAGCDAVDQLLRALIYGYVLIGWMIFFAALRPWTSDLPRPASIVVSAVVSALIVWVSVGVVGSSGNLRTALVITAVGLAAVWIGRPSFTHRRSSITDSRELSEESSPTSSTR